METESYFNADKDHKAAGANNLSYFRSVGAVSSPLKRFSVGAVSSPHLSPITQFSVGAVSSPHLTPIKQEKYCLFGIITTQSLVHQKPGRHCQEDQCPVQHTDP